MDTTQVAYNGEFTIEERKAITAQMYRELRKSKKLSQKEVAGKLGIPATTYNTYESGRTEPPIEILVRMSHLYGLPVDVIVQRDRTYKTADDVIRQLTEYKVQLTEFDRQIAEKGADAPGLEAILGSLHKLAEVMTVYSQTEAVQKAINNPSDKD